MKKTGFLLAALVALTRFAAAGGQTDKPAEPVKQVQLKWAHVYEISEPYHKWTVWAADELGKKTNGKYKISVYPAAQLGKESDLNQGLQMGAVDIMITGGSFAARFFPRIGISYYPYVFRDLDHLLAYSKSEVFAEITEEFRKKTGVMVTALTYYGLRHSASNKPFTNASEMKGIKMRVPDAVTFTAMPKACGANPAPIAYAETYLAMQTGTVDALENPLTSIEAKKFYEVSKYIITTGHMVDHIFTEIGGHVWTKLTDDEKKIFREVTMEAAEKASADIKKREAELTEIFTAKGIKFLSADKESIKKAIIANTPPESMGFLQSDFDRIQKIK